MHQIRKFLRHQEATTAVEYAIMLALILMACIVAISSFGQGSGNLWIDILSEMNTHMGS